jgi:hypothetical protein
VRLNTVFYVEALDLEITFQQDEVASMLPRLFPQPGACHECVGSFLPFYQHVDARHIKICISRRHS